jgi:hypothetical protein
MNTSRSVPASPYSFAFNDPVNRSDPSGMQPPPWERPSPLPWMTPPTGGECLICVKGQPYDDAAPKAKGPGAGMAMAFPFTVAMLYVPFPYAWGCIFFAVFFLFFNTGPANAALANVTPPDIRATAFAMNILFIHAFGDAISPPLIGYVAGKSSMNAAFLMVSGTMLLASAFWFWGARYLGEDTAAIENAPKS